MKEEKITISLNKKEAYLLWSIICWFYKPVTSSLKYKLWSVAHHFDVESGKSRREMDKKYEKQIMDRIKLN